MKLLLVGLLLLLQFEELRAGGVEAEASWLGAVGLGPEMLRLRGAGRSMKDQFDDKKEVRLVGSVKKQLVDQIMGDPAGLKSFMDGDAGEAEPDVSDAPDGGELDDISHEPREVDSSLHQAAQELNLDGIQTALANGADVNAPDPYCSGFSALHFAVRQQSHQGKGEHSTVHVVSA